SLLMERPQIPDGRSVVRGGARCIRFENVGFRYADRATLENITVEVRAGETLGIAGPSGAGKTTLLALMARFFDPQDASIRWDGSDLCDLRLAELHSQIGFVPQPPFLFSASVAENIRAGRPEATDAEVADAARAAEIHDEILALPDGYGT